MDQVAETGTKVVDALLLQGPWGYLVLALLAFCVVSSFVCVVLWRDNRRLVDARVADMQEDLDSSKKERQEIERKMERLQAIIEDRGRLA